MTTQELIEILLDRADITIEQADVLMTIAIDNGDYAVTEQDLDQLALDLNGSQYQVEIFTSDHCEGLAKPFTVK